jgi:hypothetical protein
MYYCLCDENYVPWLELLVRSVRRFDPNTRFLIHFIGDGEGLERRLADHNNLKIRTPAHPRAGGGAVELVLSRPKNVLEVARSNRFDWLMVMDADLLVRAPLTSLTRSMALYDCAAVLRGRADGGELPPHQQVAGGLYVLTERAIPMIEETVRLIDSPETVQGILPGSWYRDQACLAEAMATTDLRIRTIPREIYLSSRPYDRRAAVWNGNFSGARKGAALRLFQKECDRIAPSSVQ